MIRFSAFYFTLSSLLFGALLFIALFVNDRFVRPFLGDALVVVWLFYFLKTFLDVPSLPLAFGVLACSFLVEFAQYMEILAWLGLEDKPILKVVFGSTFDWKDLAAYTLGWFILWVQIFISAHLATQQVD
ncbi:DUF2809 domain-containing protein [Saccharospirillum mangrovi]|uniref:ribosomal maturation YjgA family protein n=1 Tax=Saccharospirillum mangrovi TaxID=2161747 RepID=UPI0018E53666|nr:DUF2809 domain-containing protein [Saccharospirillum mangrovi]